MVHLPASSYATIWYALLSLSKLSLLFHSNQLDRDIHGKGVSIVRKFEEVSVGADVWASSKKVVGNMLAWLTESLASIQSASASSQDSYRESCMDQSPTSSSENAASVDLMQLEPTEDLDAAAWQQMLDNFTWFDPGMGVYDQMHCSEQ